MHLPSLGHVFTEGCQSGYNTMYLKWTFTRGTSWDMDLIDEFSNLTAALSHAGVSFAVCGGIAVGIHGFVRFTEDIDLMILEEDLELALSVARSLGYSVDSGRIPLLRGTPWEHTVYRVVKVEGREFLPLDLVLVNEEMRSIWEDCGIFQWQGRNIQCVSRQGLMEMKRRAGRSKDLIDLEELRGVNEEDPGE